jgi:oxygen-independent coproporphyrinogen-3 oxidase
VQSFRDEDLHYLNRVHTAGQAEAAVHLAQEHGYGNLSIDLIFGIPSLEDEDLLANLETFFSFDLPHLSAYALTVEPKTALDVLIRKGKVQNLDEEKMARQFLLLEQTLREHGYNQYEISNFCKGRDFARHNTNYWLGGQYLGLGPSAHSFDGYSRQWNIARLETYITGMEKREPVFEKELLTIQQRYNEYIMVSLRCSWGVDAIHLLEGFGVEFRDYFVMEAEKFISLGLIEAAGNTFLLSRQGKLHADGIASELFYAE